MNRLVALTKREVLAYFYAPVPYLVMFLFLLMTAWIFVGTMNQQVAHISFLPVLEWLAFVLLFLMPLLTMNSVAEERASNTLETLLTAPDPDTFASAVAALLRDPARLAALRSGARDDGASFSAEDMAERFSRGVTACLDHSGAPS